MAGRHLGHGPFAHLTDATSPLVTFDIATTDGLRAFVIAAGALSPGENEEPFRLLVVNASTNPWSIAEVMPNAM